MHNCRSHPLCEGLNRGECKRTLFLRLCETMARGRDNSNESPVVNVVVGDDGSGCGGGG